MQRAAAILILCSGMVKPNRRPWKEFLMLFRNFLSSIGAISYSLLDPGWIVHEFSEFQRVSTLKLPTQAGRPFRAPGR